MSIICTHHVLGQGQARIEQRQCYSGSPACKHRIKCIRAADDEQEPEVKALRSRSRPIPRPLHLPANMVHKVLFWSGFGTSNGSTAGTRSKTNPSQGLAVRLWQLGIEMRPFFHKEGLWTYPVYAGIGASFGYWLKGVEDRQLRILAETRDTLLEKRRRRAEREGLSAGTQAQKDQEGLFASPTIVRQAGLGLPAQGQLVKTEVAE